MRYLPSEVKLVARLLDEPADDAESLAKVILAELDTARAKRPSPWALLVQNVAGDPLSLYASGPYATATQALKAAEKGVGAVTEGATALVVPMARPERWEQDNKLQKPAICPACKHGAWVHDWPKKPLGCISKFCDCKETLT